MHMLEIVFSFLALFNCYPQEAVITPSNDTFFLAGEIGVVYVRPDMYKDHVLVHELYHHCQWEWSGKKPAQTWHEWRNRESEAIRIETIYLENST
jgi:hypothetical protein